VVEVSGEDSINHTVRLCHSGGGRAATSASMTIYIDLWPSLIVHNQASLASLFQHIITRHDMMSCDRGAKSCTNALRWVPLTSNVMDAPDAACTSSLDAGDVPCAGMFS